MAAPLTDGGSKAAAPRFGVSAPCRGAGVETPPELPVGPLTRPCEPIWTTTAQALWLAQFRRTTSTRTAWTSARSVACLSTNATTVSTLGAALRLVWRAHDLGLQASRRTTCPPWMRSWGTALLLSAMCRAWPAPPGASVSHGALAATHSRNTVQAWVELLMLARCTLVAPSRGGARHSQQAALATKRRCQRWLDGERVELWEELAEQRPQRSATAGGERSLAARQSRCCSLAAEGELARACAALTEPAPVPASLEALAELRDKHPAAAAPDLAALGPARPALVPEFDAEAVIKAVRSFHRASAPGPSGLRPDHVREALATPHGDEVIAHLVSLSNLLARGELWQCTSLAPLFTPCPRSMGACGPSRSGKP